VARKAIGNRQKKNVAPRFRRPELRPASTPPRSRARPSPARHVLLLHAPLEALYAPAVWSLDPHCEVLVLREDSALPSGAERTEMYLRWWEGGREKMLSKLLAAAPGLKWVHTPSAGIDHLPLAKLRERKIILTNARGVHSIPLAESAMNFLLARAKRAAEHRENQRARRSEVLKLEELWGRRLLLFGYGSVGAEIAVRARSFGMAVSAVRRRGKRERELVRVYPPGELKAAVSEADAVVVAAPLTEETRGAFHARVFGAMGESCHFVNISRGEIVVEKDLIEGLRRGRPAFASLDVFEEEPLPSSSPLWTMENVVVTPHDSWRSPQTKARNLELFLENFRRYVAGRPMKNVVDYARGY
jgi:phosphoglycerate dehydrogenase-like enzyme